jgi:hypothetical protein
MNGGTTAFFCTTNLKGLQCARQDSASPSERRREEEEKKKKTTVSPVSCFEFIVLKINTTQITWFHLKFCWHLRELKFQWASKRLLFPILMLNNKPHSEQRFVENIESLSRFKLPQDETNSLNFFFNI